MNLLQTLILIFILMVNILGQEKCFYCKNEISGRYITVKGKAYHPEHFLCSGCNKMISGPYSIENGKFYHSECLSKMNALYCDFCSKELTGAYVHQDGKKYHESCFTESVQKKCAICKGNLSGRYEVDKYGNEYHASHRNEFEKCDACGRLVSAALTGGGKKYTDGRAVCTICYQTAVFDDAIINSLYSKVLKTLSPLGFKINTTSVIINGVDKNNLKIKAGKSYAESLRGFCDTKIKSEYKNDKLVKEIASYAVYVLNGLPPLYIEAIIAHELMHVWLNQNTAGKHTDLITEGSCNYISWLYLKSLNSNDSKRQMVLLEEDTNPVYGNGFRNIKSQFEGKPLEQLFRYLR